MWTDNSFHVGDLVSRMRGPVVHPESLRRTSEQSGSRTNGALSATDDAAPDYYVEALRV